MAEATPPKVPHLLLLLLCISAGEVTSAASSSTDFIRSSCRTTTYPALCIKCLSAYAPSVRRSPRELARAALTVSADRARSASAYVARLSAGGSKAIKAREAGAVRDCLENMADSVDRLRQSAQELGRLGRAGSAGFMWHLNNVQTWCSAALTDENTCLDSLSQSGSGSTREAIRKKVVEVAQLTSNALALVNRIGPKY
ncbi:pectinesterase inhibitor 9-like [Phoenix dactylifera]|uniref:Pectinesterase inhibitor 9-like n=1 Tax=Phoenix dactylifera TaxID=42345 RepID=A0A8B7BK50_PHODC|nr:pectinesterase inhibitor 9-like [Phoenix dactylifera]